MTAEARRTVASFVSSASILQSPCYSERSRFVCISRSLRKYKFVWEHTCASSVEMLQIPRDSFQVNI